MQSSSPPAAERPGPTAAAAGSTEAVRTMVMHEWQSPKLKL